MILTRFILNPKSRFVQQDLADCQRLHQRVMSMFPDEGLTGGGARTRFGVLHRVDRHPRSGLPVLLVQSAIQPDPSKLPAGYLVPGDAQQPNPWSKNIGKVLDGLEAGCRLMFRLRANPTKKINSWRGREGYRPNGQRVDLRRQEDQLAWLRRKGELHGFRVLDAKVRPDTTLARGTEAGSPPQVDARPAGRSHGWRTTDGTVRRLTFAAVVFEGVLEVTDPERFRHALVQGIGPAKAYGFGLMTLAKPA